MAEAVNWPSIERAGLLSARALLELAGVPEAERGQVDLEQRTGPLLLPGGMVIRDQKPMPPAALERCLHGMTPAQAALAWLLANPAVTAPIIGPRTTEQLDGTLRALEIPLSREILEKLDEIFPGPGGPAPEAYAW